MFRPKKSGANLYNSRTKSSKKSGGQLNHEGHHLSKKEIEDKMSKEKVKVIEIKHTISGNSNQMPSIKYKLGVNVETVVEKHIFKYSENSTEKMPKEFYTDVTYTDDFKSLVIYMNVHNVLSLNRLVEFFDVVTNGIIKLSQGTIINFLR